MKNVKKILGLIATMLPGMILSQTISQSATPGSGLVMGRGGEDVADMGRTVHISEKKSEPLPNQLSVIVSTDKVLSVNNIYEFQLSKKAGSDSITYTDNFFILGLDAGAKMNNSVGAFFNNRDIAGGTTANALMGFKLFHVPDEVTRTFSEGAIDHNMTADEIEAGLDEIGSITGHWIYLNAGVEGRKFNSYLPQANFGDQIQKVRQSLGSITVGYNFWKPTLHGNLLAGVSGGLKWTDNFGDLTEFTVVDGYAATNDTISRKGSSATTTYVGQYHTPRKSFLQAEAYYVPYYLAFFGVYAGIPMTMEKEKPPLFDFNFGIFFMKRSEVLNPSVGIVATYTDLFDQHDIDDGKRLSINLVTRFPLGKM